MISLKNAGCSVIYVDGSFVTSKPIPGDFDACWDTNSVDINKLRSIAPNSLNFKNKRAAQKSQYKGEFLLADRSANQAGIIFLDFFRWIGMGIQKVLLR